MTRKQLFNGRDLAGWKMVGPGSIDVEDGLLKTSGGMGLLYYTVEIVGNAVLRVVYRVRREEDNSGVFVRIAEEPPDPWYAVHHGYEVQIHATGGEWHDSGCIYSLSKTLAQTQLPPGDWNTMDIALRGQQIDVTLNDTLVTQFDPTGPLPERKFPYEPERGTRPDAGYVGLQNHDGESVVYFREVSMEALP